MSLLPTLRRLAIGLPVALVATALPIVRSPDIPQVRQWAIRLDGSGPVRAPGEFGLIGVSWPAASDPPDGVAVRTSRDGIHWSSWEDLEVEPDRGRSPDGDRIASMKPLWVGRARHADVRFRPAVPSGAQAHFVDPGADPHQILPTAVAYPSRPRIFSRAEWGADESMRRGRPSYAEPLKMAIVHHTATGNSYSRSESARIVRSIYAYHVQTNGWADIGYNFLVDRHGQLFEGRAGGIDRSVVGAHAGGFNRQTTGIAVIGSFDQADPPAAAIEALKKILAWRLDLASVHPKWETPYTSGGSSKYAAGTRLSLKTISGHRDVGNTDCPGRLYGRLGGLRSAVADWGSPKVFAPSLSRSIITPGRDGYADNVHFTAHFSSSVSWKIEVVDPGGAVIRSATGNGTKAVYTWDGTNSSGVAVPHDAYRFRVGGSNSRGRTRTVELRATVWRYPNGTLLRSSASGWAAILEGGDLRRVLTSQAIATRYWSSETIWVSEELKTAYPLGKDAGFRDGTVLRADNRLWLISDGMRRPVTRSTLDRLGFQRDAVIATSTSYLAPHPIGPQVAATGGYPNGSALRSSDSGEAIVFRGQVRPFSSGSARKSYAIRTVELAGPADTEVARAALNTPMAFRNGSLMRVRSAPVYVIEHGKRRRITSDRRFAAMGYKASAVRTVTEFELALHPEGPAL